MQARLSTLASLEFSNLCIASEQIDAHLSIGGVPYFYEKLIEDIPSQIPEQKSDLKIQIDGNDIPEILIEPNQPRFPSPL